MDHTESWTEQDTQDVAKKDNIAELVTGSLMDSDATVRIFGNTITPPIRRPSFEFEDRVVHPQFLQSMILNQDNKVTVYPSIVTFSGLPNSGSSIALQKILGTPVETETSAIIGFSHHSIIATGYKQPSKIYCAEVNNTNSNLYCFQSGLQNSLFHQQESPVFNDLLEQNMSTFKDPALSHHISEVYETCKHLYTTVNQAVQEKQSRLHALKKKLPGGVATINVWDLAINRAIHTFLEMFSGRFHRHHMWLFLSLDRDADKLHEPPESNVFPGALRDSKVKIWRSRLHCLLRSSKLSDSLTPRNRKMCTLFAIHTSSQDAVKEKIETLQSECENAAHQFEVSDLIDFNVIPVDLSNESDSKRLLMEKFTELLQQLECHEIPLSWVFLCGSFKYHKSIFMTRNELQKKAEECGINKKSLRDFCVFFTSFGSIIDISIIDPRSEIIVIKPYQFLAQLNKLLNLGSKVSIADQYGLITEEAATSDGVFGSSGKVFMGILDSVGLVAKVSKNRIPPKYNIPDTNGPLFYKPFIRTTLQTMKCSEKSIYLVNGVDAPPMIMEVEFTNELLNLLSRSLFLPSCDMNVTVVQVVPPDIVGDPIDIQVTYQGDIVELNVLPCGRPNTADMDKVCDAIVEASHNIAERRLARNAGNVKYHFAVTCARDKYPTVAFNIHHRQHILPNEKLCEECCEKKVDVHLQSWNRALTKNPIPKKLQLNGDLSQDNIMMLARVIGSYPMEVISAFGNELNLKPADEEMKWWCVFQMIMEWMKKREDKEDESSKMSLARKLLSLHKKFPRVDQKDSQESVVSTSTYVPNLPENQEHVTFETLAKRLDILLYTQDTFRSNEQQTNQE